MACNLHAFAAWLLTQPSAKLIELVDVTRRHGFHLIACPDTFPWMAVMVEPDKLTFRAEPLLDALDQERTSNDVSVFDLYAPLTVSSISAPELKVTVAEPTILFTPSFVNCSSRDHLPSPMESPKCWNAFSLSFADWSDVMSCQNINSVRIASTLCSL